jgi:hypothetical protein
MARKLKSSPGALGNLFAERMSAATDLAHESDRGVVLITAAFLDEALASLLRRCLIDQQDVVDELFGNDRPLGTFSARIRMTYCLGHMSSATFRDLETIRGIRNEFAHSWDMISFSTQSVRDRCMNLHPPIILPGSEHPDFSSPRQRYIACTLGIGGRFAAREHEISRPMYPEKRA